MTTSLIHLQKEYLQTGATYSSSSSVNNVIQIEFDAARPLPVKGASSLGGILSKLADDAVLQEAMKAARKYMAESLYADEPESLSALRLRAGLSQAQLAEKMETTQSQVARVELGKVDPSTKMVARFAVALGVEESQAFKAIRHQIESRNKKNEC